jgi:hypothetical protein
MHMNANYRGMCAGIARSGIASLLALALILMPALGLAQGGGAPRANPRLASLNIEIWPEYDRPAALVILRAVLAEGVKLPATVTLKLPAASGGPSAVAHSTTADGNLLSLKHEAAKAGDFIVVKFETPSRFFHVEFYEPIPTADAARSFRYVWPGDLAAESFRVIVQEPVSATGFSVEPRLETLSTGQDGLHYRTADLGPREAGKAFPITVRYTKADARPSTETLIPKAPAAPAPAAASPTPPAASLALPAAAAASGGLPDWALPLAGLALLGLLGAGVILWWWRRESKIVRPATRFCAKCGAPQAADSRFCSTCGAKVA